MIFHVKPRYETPVILLIEAGKSKTKFQKTLKQTGYI
jgi:hypothetical protein